MITHTTDRLELSGVHVTYKPLAGPWAGSRAALVTRWPNDTWDVEMEPTAPRSVVVRVLDSVAALRQFGAGNTGWCPGPGGTLWRYF